MIESKICLALGKVLRKELPGYIVTKHAVSGTVGVPDFSVTGDGMTTWLEVKRDGIHGVAAQALMMERMARAGSCYYVVFCELTVKTARRSYIVSPLDRENPVEVLKGWNYNDVAIFVENLHNRNKRLISRAT